MAIIKNPLIVKGGASANLQSINILSNGRYQASDYDVDGWNDIEVAVPMSFTSIDLNISQNGSYAPSDYSVDAFGKVTVDVQYATSALSIIDNGVYKPSDYGVDAFSEVTVNVPQEANNTIQDLFNKTLSGSIYNSSITFLSAAFFASQSLLEEVNLPSVITLYSGQTFRNCTQLKKVTLASGWRISYYSTYNWSAEGSQFQGCSNLETIIGDYGSTSIPSYMFYGCNKLSDITFLSAVKVFGSAAFLSCFSLVNVELEEAVTFYYSVFTNCTNLEVISLPKLRLFSYGAGIFINCKKLREIHCPVLSSMYIYSVFGGHANLSLIDAPILHTISANYGAFMDTAITEALYKCAVMINGSSAFYNCLRLSKAYFPLLSQAFGINCFLSCYSLESFFAPWLQTSMYSSFFSNTKVSIHLYRNISNMNGSVTCATQPSLLYIGYEGRSANFSWTSAFLSAKTVVLNFQSVTTLYTANNISLTSSIYVPDSLLDAYKSATNWVTYSNRIHALSEYKMPIVYDGNQYSVYYGSTWTEFINSSDNTLGFNISGDNVYDNNGVRLCGITSNSKFIEPYTEYTSYGFTLNGVEFPFRSGDVWADFMGTIFNLSAVASSYSLRQTTAASWLTILSSSYYTGGYARGYAIYASSAAVSTLLSDSNGDRVFTLDAIVNGGVYTV